jgi:flagellar protein FliS
MNPNEIATLYRETSTRGNRPVELVVKLYDAILEDLRRAMNAAGTGDVQGRTASLNHALLVIAELQSVLDHAQGGEIAQRLDGFYNVTRALIVDANLHSSPERVQRLIDLYMPLRQAWKQAENETSSGNSQMSRPAENIKRAASATGPADPSDSDVEHAQWNA